ncbi:hypothetical protein N9E67_02415 [Amylibacter sp.]|nr:hypothetical protein [Amylibacter sp.]
MLRKIAGEKILDLSSHHVVLGSGLSAVSAIHGILDSSGGDDTEILVIDASIGKKLMSKSCKADAQFKMPSPKFKINANRYVYENFRSILNITSDRFHAIGSLAKGGLSNIWGGTIQPYNKQELSEYPYSYTGVKNIYSKIYKILTGLEIDFNDLEEDFATNGRFSIRNPLLAINEKNDDESSCKLESCATGCIYCNKNVFNSSSELDSFISNDSIKYQSGLFVESIYQKKGYYLIKCIEILTGKILIVKASVVFCSLGAISTAKLVLKMSNSPSRIPLLTTPGGAFFMFSFHKFHKLDHQILSSKAFKGKVEKKCFEGNIFPVSENLLCTYFGERLGGLAHKLFGPVLFSRIYIANIFFSSDLSSSSLLTINDVVKISARIDPDLKLTFSKALKLIKKELNLEGLHVLPFGKKLLKPGQDIHYGGLIPMKKVPQENQCDFNGELYGFKNFYITDSAAMPYLASKGHSFNSMVNAYYIASKSVKQRHEETALSR